VASPVRLRLLPRSEYAGVNRADPIRYYYWPIIGKYYRLRVELCISECSGGERILEVGFGTGLAFLNLAEKYDEIHGLDLTANVEKVARAHLERGLKVFLRQGDVLQMPYPENMFDTVLLISILEHLQPTQQILAFRGIWRVLKPGGQVVYGVPVERAFMALVFRLMGVDIRRHHFSTEYDVSQAAERVFGSGHLKNIMSPIPPHRPVYQVGHFKKE